MRKIKEGYRLSYCFIYTDDEVYHTFTSTKESIQKCLDNNMEIDYTGDRIIDYQFFTPNGFRCTLMGATEIQIQEGTYWKEESGDVILIVLDRSKLPLFDSALRARYLVIFSDGISAVRGAEEFEDCVQVKNWEGDPL